MVSTLCFGREECDETFLSLCLCLSPFGYFAELHCSFILFGIWEMNVLLAHFPVTVTGKETGEDSGFSVRLKGEWRCQGAKGQGEGGSAVSLEPDELSVARPCPAPAGGDKAASDRLSKFIMHRVLCVCV